MVLAARYKETMMDPTEKCEQDLGPLQAEVKRLLETHDARLVFGALISSAVSIGQLLSKHGKSTFVVDTFIEAAHDATGTPKAPAIYVEETSRRKS